MYIHYIIDSWIDSRHCHEIRYMDQNANVTAPHTHTCLWLSWIVFVYGFHDAVHREFCTGGPCRDRECNCSRQGTTAWSDKDCPCLWLCIHCTTKNGNLTWPSQKANNIERSWDMQNFHVLVSCISNLGDKWKNLIIQAHWIYWITRIDQNNPKQIKISWNSISDRSTCIMGTPK